MSIVSIFDPELGAVIFEHKALLRTSDLLQLLDVLEAEPAYDGRLHEVHDLTTITEVEVDYGDLLQLWTLSMRVNARSENAGTNADKKMIFVGVRPDTQLIVDSFLHALGTSDCVVSNVVDTRSDAMRLLRGRSHATSAQVRPRKSGIIG